MAVAQTAFNISGLVYQDFNNSGSRENTAAFSEPPVNGVEVRAYDSANTLLACNRTGPTDCTGAADADAAGTYTLAINTLFVGDAFRLEFINVPSDLQPGTHIGTGANGQGTTVQFFTSTGAAIVNSDLPLTAIGRYCGGTPGTPPSPDLITSCYVFGDQTAGATSVLLFNYAASGNLAGVYQQLLTDIEAGSVYGFAYHNLTDQIFFANYFRRHAGTFPNGGVAGTNLDTLYMYDRRTDSLITFDMGTLTGASFGTDGRSAPWNFIEEDTVPGTDVNNWDNVGKNGVGDVEISTDGSTLFVTNLFLRRIEIFTIDYGPTSATGFTANPAAVTLTPNGALTPAVPCTGGTARPFGLGYYNGSIYSGWVCDAGTSNLTADLEAYVFQGNTQVFSMELAFTRGCAGADFSATCAFGGDTHPGAWNPWSSVFTVGGQNPGGSPGGGDEVNRPEPMLSDIEFDSNGNMILGFRDRFADEVGFNSLSDPGSAALYSSWSAGDMYHVCLVNGTYVLEGDASGSCPQNAANNDGPNGGEFYPSDNTAGFHGEAYQGSLTHVAGLPDVVTSILDPLNTIYTGGFRWVNNTTGAASKSGQLFSGMQNAGKGNGIGDIEPLCPPPEMEIGNFIWLEDTRDGVQGTGVETTVAGILVELVDPVSGVVIATTTTDASGHYYFNSASAWTTPTIPFWDMNGDGVRGPAEPQGILAFTNYEVRVAASNFTAGNPLENYNLTDINVGSGNTDPSGDSISDSSPLSVNITTSAFGVNNHTIDFGFTRVPPPGGAAGGGGAGGGGAGGGAGGGTGGQPGNQGPAGPARPIINVEPLQPFVSPGNQVDWLITVSNPTGGTLTGASIILTVPGNLNLLGGVGNGGNVRINGAGVVMALNPIPPGGSATLTLNTTAIRNLLAQNITLVAGLQLADGTIIFDDGTVYRPPNTLPYTGSSPLAAWRMPILLAAVASLLASAFVVKLVRQRPE